MSSERPQVIVLGGPNGAGKSTAAPYLLPAALAVTQFVNADTVAEGLSAFDPERSAMQAGRIMLARLKELAGQRADFAFEITLASRTFAPWIASLVRFGYSFHLVYLWLPTPALAVGRVAQRVHTGGHNVPEETIRRRYRAGLVNFFRLYRPMAATWRFYDNSFSPDPRLLAAGRKNAAHIVGDSKTWQRINAEFNHD